MNLEAGKITMVFVKEFDGRKTYSIGLSKKNKNGSYENGFMSARFKKDVEIANKTRIKIKEAFLSFNVKDNKTFPYIFINDYEIISETNPEHKEIQEMTNDEHYKTKSDTFEQVEITDEDLPF
jgi:glutaredoxin